MKIWINKTNYTDPSSDFSDAIVFNMLDENPKSNLKTNFEEMWRRFSKRNIESIYEDFLVFAASVFATDKRVPRREILGSEAKDNWTRKLEMCVPVINIHQWISVKGKLEEALNFLSGDIWSLTFRETKERYRDIKDRKKYSLINNKFDGVCLFSGGLDSFSGAIKLLQEERNICFVGCMEYNQLNNRIQELYQLIRKTYANVKSDIIVFSVNPKVPANIDDNLKSLFTENTSRSRSLLFIAGAIATASLIGNDVPVYIPENGFIGLNLPLTPSRVGSCSTRTTHIFFLRQLNDVLSMLGIPHKIENFFAYKTKGEILEEIKHTKPFLEGAGRTISCSHPTQGRIDGATVPINCGYCFPCLIRRAALLKVGYSNERYLDSYNSVYKLSTGFIKKYYNPDSGRAKDLKAILAALHKYLQSSEDGFYMKEMAKLGGLSMDDIKQFYQVYIKSMEELKSMIISQANKNDLELLNYVGLEDKNE
jgi:7-cyano-7-deazaguanine synthase in queuosine biosynthesis